MKRHYTIYIIAVISIICLQAVYIKSQYNNYISTEQAHIENILYRAIDLELHARIKVSDISKQYVKTLTTFREMSKSTRDSLLAIHPLPENPPKFNYDIMSLIEKGVIRHISDIYSQKLQDAYYDENIEVNLNLLDSIFDINLGRNYENQFTVYDNDKVTNTLGDKNIKYNYTSTLKQLGFNECLFIELKTHITVSDFIKQSIWILIISLLIISLPIISLFYQLTAIRNKTTQLAINEINICGTIHDLKSPLNSIFTMLSWLEKSEKELNKANIINSYKDNLLHLIKNIETLLNITKSQKSSIVTKEAISVLELNNVMNIVTEELDINYPNKKDTITIMCNIPNETILHINIFNYENIIRNLLDNALKYSDDNVNVKMLINITDNKTLLVSVKDNGWGIEKKYYKHIFKQFYRIQNNREIKKGHGVGLAYVKHIIQAHDGKIWVKSIKGKGSEFNFTLNVDK